MISFQKSLRYLDMKKHEDSCLLKRTSHYMHFAMAAYGWPMYLFQNRTVPVYKAIYRLATSIQCCCHGQELDTVLISDNCCSCNLAALRQVLALKNCTLVYATFHVDVGETPFFIGVDFEEKTIVISIRGTLSMKVLSRTC